METAATHAHELIGQTLRPGLVVDADAAAVIGAGTFGTVVRGRQLAIDRAVAIKVLHPWFDPSSEPGCLFQDEIRAIGRIDHRNVVRIFDAGVTDDGRLYFAMELVAGVTCQELVRVGPLPAARAVELAAQLLAGLDAVHAAGHIHADVKPSNVLVAGALETPRVVLIDFGLSRLRQLGGPAEAVGGTRAFMAPEQRTSWQVEPRSDVYSAALLLVYLLTGWQRADDDEGEGDAPPLSRIDDLALRTALGRALAREPAERPSAADFLRALRGDAPAEPAPLPAPPFRQLAPLTEHDRGLLFGRDDDLVRLARGLERERVTVFTAPSGTGKTSLLRAGLVPYLAAAGQRCVYVACHPEPQASSDEAATAAALTELTRALCPTAATLPAALDDLAASAAPLVLVLDQVEAHLARPQLARAVLAPLLEDERPGHAHLALVLAVREDFLAQLVALSPALARGVPLLRLAPLDRAGAEAALTEPLRRRGVTVSDELRREVLADLLRAGQEHGADAGWRDAAAIYPPHVQLVGAALFGALAAAETELTLAHYQRLGGFAAIVGDSLERSLRELSAEDRQVARALFLAWVGASHTKVACSEAELALRLPAERSAALPRVLAHLELHRLVSRRTSADGDVLWELLHDSLIPRIEAWLTVQDLDRRRAAELLRFHLRESTPRAPSLLSARQLRLVAKFRDLEDELEAEWQRRPPTPWTPRRLLARSRMAAQYRRGLAATVSGLVLGLATLLAWTWQSARAQRAEEAQRRDRDLGRFDLELAPFDWRLGANGVEPVAVDAAALPQLAWTLYEPDDLDPSQPGAPVSAERLRHGTVEPRGSTRLERGAQARGGDAFLSVSGRGRAGQACPPSILRLQRLPGYATASHPPKRIRIEIPTCQATAFDTIEIPAGPFFAGGRGEPPSSFSAEELPPEEVRTLPAFAIDRTEISNAAYAVFAAMSSHTGVVIVSYPEDFAFASGPRYPRTDLTFADALSFCRYLGKALPSSDEWQKAMRGGLTLPDGSPNPRPRRNYPWGAEVSPMPAHLADTASGQRGPIPVDAAAGDRSPYGVLGLAGNVQEWTGSIVPDVATKGPSAATLPMLVTRGGNWADTPSSALADYMISENKRSPRMANYQLGARCALRRAPTSRSDVLRVQRAQRALEADQRVDLED